MKNCHAEEPSLLCFETHFAVLRAPQHDKLGVSKHNFSSLFFNISCPVLYLLPYSLGV